MTAQEMKSVLDAAGIRVTEAAKLFRVANSTMYRWLEGEKSPKQQVVYDLAVGITRKIDYAVSMGWLPVKDARGKQRLVEIESAIRYAAVDLLR